MKMKFKNFTPAIVLGAICLIVAALLAVVNHFTSPVIAENERIARTASLRAVFGGEESDADFDQPIPSLPEGTPQTVEEIYKEKNGKGYAVIVSTQGYAGEIAITVGVGTDGKIVGIAVTKSEESKYREETNRATQTLVGQTKDDINEKEALVAGATVSSKAIKGAVKDAISAVELVMKSETSASLTSQETVPEMTNETIVAKGMELLEGAVGFELVDTSEAGFKRGVEKIFKETSGKGYLVYCKTRTEWNPRETELVFVLDAGYSITGFDITYWTLSPSYQAEVQIFGDHEDVKKFENSFIGANQTNLGSEVDLVSKATTTSYNIYNAVTEALDYLDRDVDGRVKEAGHRLLPNATDFEKVDLAQAYLYKGTKALFKETTGKGYVAYIRTATQYNPDETRFVVALDESFAVTGVEIWRWSTGVYEGATMPESPAVDTLVNSLVGVNKTTFADKTDLVTSATGTSGNIMAAVAELVNYLDSNLEAYILAFASATIKDAAGFEAVDISAAQLTSGIKRIYKETSGKGFVVYAMTSTKYNPQETEFVFVLNNKMKVIGFDLWFWSTGTYEGMTGSDAYTVDLLEKSFIGVGAQNIDQKVDLVSGATGTTNNMKAAVAEAINYLDPPSEVNVPRIIATVVFFGGIVAIGAAIYFQRRRRI